MNDIYKRRLAISSLKYIPKSVGIVQEKLAHCIACWANVSVLIAITTTANHILQKQKPQLIRWLELDI